MEMILIYALIVEFTTTFVHCGCYEKQFCCLGRNLSCMSTESDNFIVPHVGYSFRRRRNPTLNDRYKKSVLKNRIKNKKFRRSDSGFSSVFFEPEFEKKSEEIHDSHLGMFIKDIESDQKIGADSSIQTNTLSPKMFRTTEKFLENGFKPVVFEPEVDDSQMKSDELPVAYFGLDEEPETDPQEGVIENVEYKGNDKEIRYIIINDKPSKERVGHLKSQHLSPSSVKNQACFCDQMCSKFADCCSDYHNFCPSVDCRVTDWSEWSPCENNNRPLLGYYSSNNCGPGVSKRVRLIVTKGQNGGAHCPHIEEEKSCFNMDDDVALLLPYNFGAPRVPGYRNKTYFDLPKDINKFKKLKNSCVLFRSIWFNNCAEDLSRKVFLPNAQICVECQPTAYLSRINGSCTGEGSTTTVTHWSLINAKTCYGQWIQLETKNDCKCDKSYPSAKRLIFV